MPKNDTSILLRLSEEEKNKFQENTESMSETLRRMVRAYNEMGGEYDIDDDLDRISVVILKSYKNAIEQNEQLMKSQIDKIDEELEKYEKEDEENEQILVEVDLDIATKNI